MKVKLFPLLTLSWLAFLMTALWIAVLTPPAKGYELSTLDAYPELFWGCIFLSGVSSTSILLIAAAQKDRSSWWGSGALGVMLGNVFILSLVFFRGYPINDRADTLHHLGYVQDIVATGQASDLDFYPAMHFIQFALTELVLFTPGQAIVVVNIIFYCLKIVAVAFFVGQLARDFRAVYLAVAFAAPFYLLYYHTLALPSTLSSYLVPLFLGLHLRRSSVESATERTVTSILEVIVAFFLVYFHPATTFYLVILLGGWNLVSLSYYKLADRRVSAPIYAPQGMVVLLGTALLTWSFSYSVLTGRFVDVLNQLLGANEGTTALGEAVGLVQMANLAPGDLISILLNAFGLPVILCGVTLLVAGGLVFDNLRRHSLKSLPYMDIAMLTLLGLAYLMGFGGAFLSTAERYPLRLLRISVLLSLCCLTIWCWRAFWSPERRSYWLGLNANHWQGLIAVGLFSAMGLGQLNIYPHPRNGQPNPQVTQSEIIGMKWLTLNRNIDWELASVFPEYIPRFETSFLGYAGVRVRPNWWKEEIWLPSHFYDPSWNCIAQISPTHTYLVVSENARIAPLRFPASVRERAHLYLSADEARLADDPSVDKIYNNGAFQVWVTDPAAERCY